MILDSGDGYQPSLSTYSPRPASRSLTLHLGVLEQPYRVRDRKFSPLTTWDVAKILEKKYGIIRTFYRIYQKDIAKAIEGSLSGALESLLMGQTIDPWGRGTQAIQQQFRDFISSKKAEQVGIPGTPTLAALQGVNHRLKHPYSLRNPRRPSFRDTGMYMNSFRSWID